MRSSATITLVQFVPHGHIPRWNLAAACGFDAFGRQFELGKVLTPRTPFSSRSGIIAKCRTTLSHVMRSRNSQPQEADVESHRESTPAWASSNRREIGIHSRVCSNTCANSCLADQDVGLRPRRKNSETQAVNLKLIEVASERKAESCTNFSHPRHA